MLEPQHRLDENHYTMTFGGDYGYKDGAESMILSALHAESMMFSAHTEAHAESMILSAHAIIVSAFASVCAESITSQRALRVNTLSAR
jgi:hypothetical protein